MAKNDRRDGSHDFDWELGAWRTHLRRLRGPLTGSTDWVEYEGTSIVRSVWEGRANLLELDVNGPAGRIEGLSLRLYRPDTGQWYLHFANAANGVLVLPAIGEFTDGRGEFWTHDDIEGRAILSRFVISEITSISARFEQAFSDDGGRSWEANWVAVDTRIDEPGN